MTSNNQSVSKQLDISINATTLAPTFSPTFSSTFSPSVSPAGTSILTATEYIAIGILCFILLCACGYIGVFLWGFIGCDTCCDDYCDTCFDTCNHNCCCGDQCGNCCNNYDCCN